MGGLVLYMREVWTIVGRHRLVGEVVKAVSCAWYVVYDCSQLLDPEAVSMLLLDVAASGFAYFSGLGDL